MSFPGYFFMFERQAWDQVQKQVMDQKQNMYLSIISSEGKVLAMVGTKRAEQTPER